MVITLESVLELLDLLIAWANKYKSATWADYVILGLEVMKKLLPLVLSASSTRTARGISIDWGQLLQLLFSILAKLLPILLAKLTGSKAVIDTDPASAIAEEIADELGLE